MRWFKRKWRRARARARERWPRSRSRPAPAPDLLLEPLEPRVLLSTFTVTNTLDAFAGSLRWAINQANWNPGLDTIDFDIGGGGPQTIQPLSELPDITGAVVIDGTTQPGFSGDPLITIDGVWAGNNVDGLHIRGGGSTIRSLAITRFGDDGIYVTDNGGNSIIDNHIGVDRTGTLAQGNRDDGIEIETAGNWLEGNVVGANGEDGIEFHGFGANDNVAIGNYVGTDRSGTLALGNQGNGFQLEGGSPSRNTIGGTAAGEGNVIAFSGDTGIGVKGGTRNAIRGNAIYSNTNLGIDLHPPGPNANDAGDADTGTNQLQNYPVITAAATDPLSTRIQGTLNSTAGTTFGVDLFASPDADGEGRVYLGSTTVATDGTGNASFDVTLGLALSSGDHITATATDPFGNTSEFCLPQPVTENQLPVAVADSASIAEDTVSVAGNLLANDSDPDGDPLAVASINGVADPAFDVAGAYGTLDWASDGSYTYLLDNTDPAVQALGVGDTLTDTFSYTISDGQGGTATSTLTVTITGTNDTPVIDVVVLDEEETPPGDQATEPTPAPAPAPEYQGRAMPPARDSVEESEVTAASPQIERLRFEPIAQLPPIKWRGSVLVGDSWDNEDDEGAGTDSAPLQPSLQDFGNDLIEKGLADEKREFLASSVAATGAIALSVGFLSFLLRAGSLFGALLASLPVWHRVDFLSVLALSEREKKKREAAIRREEETELREEKAMGRVFGKDRRADE